MTRIHTLIDAALGFDEPCTSSYAPIPSDRLEPSPTSSLLLSGGELTPPLALSAGAALPAPGASTFSASLLAFATRNWTPLSTDSLSCPRLPVELAW